MTGDGFVDRVAVEGDHHGCAGDCLGRDVDEEHRPSSLVCPRGCEVDRLILRDPFDRFGFRAAQADGGHSVVAVDGDREVAPGERRVAVQSAQAAQGSEPPRLFATGDRSVVGRICRADAMGVRTDADVSSTDDRLARVVSGRDRPVRCDWRGHSQPTAPSICSSISRLSSSAYSIGSSRAIGSMKPRTIIAIASSSVSPRLIR